MLLLSKSCARCCLAHTKAHAHLLLVLVLSARYLRVLLRHTYDTLKLKRRKASNKPTSVLPRRDNELCAVLRRGEELVGCG